MDSQMDSQYLSLVEYSNKYKVSVSTLRRKIRTKQLPYNIKFGKYFLKDQNLEDSKIIKTNQSKKDNYILNQNKITQEEKSVQKQINVKDIPSYKPINSSYSYTSKEVSFLSQQVSFLDQIKEMQKDFFKQIEKKEEKLAEQKDKISELNIFINLLKTENKELKSLLHQEKNIETWLEL